VAIAGATGYAGQELVRILARHPAVTLTAAMSSGATSAPRPLPALARIWDGAIVSLDVERLVADADIVFLALPEGGIAELAPCSRSSAAAASSISPAPSGFETLRRGTKWYPATDCPARGHGLRVFGAEPRRDSLGEAALNPGCYPTAALMALAAAGRIEGLLVGTGIVDAEVGVSGAGKGSQRDPARTFSENHGSVAAYGIFSHRTQRRWSRSYLRRRIRVKADTTSVTFVPHLVPLGSRESSRRSMSRFARARQKRRSGEALTSAYADAPFVRLTGSTLPEIKHVAHTNFCDIGWKVDEAGSRAVLVAVLDNLVKGAAGSAVQNLNIMLGIDERTGLL
jgi:N-acetyl-gamma-glutamyl-phosphate reductase